MNYLKVKWTHTSPDEPVWLYSEVDDKRWEVRKVEIFADGRMCFADRQRSSGTTGLGQEPLPELADISADPEFEPSVISGQEFEVVWQSANRN